MNRLPFSQIKCLTLKRESDSHDIDVYLEV